MKRRLAFGCLLALGVVLTARPASAQTPFSVSAHVGNFHVAVANYYHVPEREVIVIRERHIADDEIPVVLFIAQRARVAPAKVIAMRQSGRSWWEISVHYGLGPEVYYVPVTVVAPGPPYGKAYGHYKKGKKKKTIVLADDDIVNLVHLRFLSEHYRVAPERVIEVRARHADFVVVHSEIGEGKSHGKHGNKKGRGH